jgi:Spy/CpxP family protein refolding chaperone
MEEFKKQLAQVLNKEQMHQATEILKPKRHHRGKGGQFGKGEGHHRRKGQGGYLRQLKLTNEQRADIRKIMKDARKDAQAAKDRDAKRKIFAKARKKVFSTVLTAQQRKKVKELRRKDHPLYGIATDKQIDRANKIMARAHKAAVKAKTPEERRKINAAARKKIYDEVLTADQRKKLDERRKQRRAKMCKRFADKIGLSDEQQAQARKIMDKAREKAQDAKTRQEKHKIMRAAHEKIRKEVMTDEQREKLKDMRPRGRHRGRGGRCGPESNE